MPSKCHCFFSGSDFNISRHFINDVKNSAFKQHKLKMLSKMEEYLTTSRCRRRLLLAHFENRNLDDIGGTENCCDNCRKKIEKAKHQSYYDSKNWSVLSDNKDTDEPTDYSKEAHDLFTAIMALGSRFGIMVPCQFLVGSNNQKVKPFTGYKEFGSGKYRKQDWWKAFAKSLIYEGYLNEKKVEGGFGCTIELSQKAHNWMNKSRGDKKTELKILPTADMLNEEKLRVSISVKPLIHRHIPDVTNTYLSKTISTASNVTATAPPKPVVDERLLRLQNDLYTKLVLQRNELAQETGYTPHSIASNKVLLDMAKIRPSSKPNLFKLEDFAQAKIEKFGAVFLKIITSFCTENDLKMDDFPQIDIEKTTEDLSQEIMSLTETQRTSYIMFVLQNKDLEEIASLRGIKTSTVVSHLCEAIKVGLDVDMPKLGITPQIQSLITATIRGPKINSDISRLTKIKDCLPTYIEYNHIKIVISQLIQKYGQEVKQTGELILNSPTEDTDNNLQFAASSPSNGKEPVSSWSRWNKKEPVSSWSRWEDSKKTETDSQSQNSQNESQDSQGQSSSSSGSSTVNKRKVPGWMSSDRPPVISKKMKKNSLFR